MVAADPDLLPVGSVVQVDAPGIPIEAGTVYLAPPDLHACRDLIVSHLRTGGHLLLIHWTPFVADYPLTGDEVHDRFLELAAPLDHDRDALAPCDLAYTSGRSLQHLAHARAEQYRLDLFERR